MLINGRKKVFMETRCGLTGFSVVWVISVINSRNMTIFLYKNVISIFGVPIRIIINSGSENLGKTRDLLIIMGIYYIQLSTYNPQTNGMIKEGHYPITNSLRRLINNGKDWIKWLMIVLL